ncbi:hypothetical protein AB6859_23280 [Rahnella inusitata]|uniref:hypothetical protein n=1 Tax=Rahnella inusitata TaxID=58169 RepID=UPI0010A3BBA4|nr:hypothetical protein ERD95_25770 [Enterobacteriaceae bacterium ML5]
MNKCTNLRQQFIDALFTQHGRCSCRQLTTVFGINKSTAALDMKAYAQRNRQVAYSYTHGSYMRRSKFQPVPALLKQPADNFLQMVSAVFEVPDLSIERNLIPLPRGGIDSERQQ